MKRNFIQQTLVFSGMAGCMAACIMASSCKDEARGQVYDPNVPVTVTDFYPDSGGVATQMILNGSNFGTDLNNIQVYFRFSTVWHNHLRNKHLTEHLRNNSNELATVRFSAFCGAMLSNNSFLMQR